VPAPRLLDALGRAFAPTLAFAIGSGLALLILTQIVALLVIFVQPLMLLLLYGYALNFDVRHVRLAVEESAGGDTQHVLAQERLPVLREDPLLVPELVDIPQP